MPSSQGPLTWERFAPFERPPRFAGVDLSGRLRRIRFSPVDAGIALPMLDGGFVFQVEPLPEGASLSRASGEVTLSYSSATEDDSRLAGRLQALCREAPQELICWSVVSDYWRITATARTSWPLSRRSANAPPDVHSGEIWHADGTRTALTLVSGTPGAGEIAVASNVATTADLSALSGDLLEVRYYPVYMVYAVSRTEDSADAGSMDFELTCQEWLP